MRKAHVICGMAVLLATSIGAAPNCTLNFAPAPLGFIGREEPFVNLETPHVSPLDLTPSGGYLAAVNTPASRLEIFDISATPPTWVASVSVGLEPVSVRARTDGELWVVNHVSDSVSIVNIANRSVTRTLATHDEPTDVVFAAGRAFVTCSQVNEVQVFDLANLDIEPVVLTIEGEDPRALAVSPDGTTVYAAIFESGNDSTIIGEPEASKKENPYGGQNPAPNFGESFSPPMKDDLPRPPRVSMIVRKDLSSGKWMDDNNHDWSSLVTWDLHDHDVAVIDAATLSVSYISHLMNLDMALSVRPDGMLSVVGTEATNQIRYEPNLTGQFVHSVGALVDPANPSAASVIELNPHLADAYARRESSVSTSLRAKSLADPRGIAWRADGSAGYITGLGSNNVIKVDSSLGRLDEINVGQGPTGLRIDEARGRMYVMNKFDASISVVDLASNEQTSTVKFYDPTPAEIKNGRPLLYDAKRTSGLGVTACAACHIDGRMDQIAWDLGNPAGDVKMFDQQCNNPMNQLSPPKCGNFHPMKGPMMTQTMQGLAGTEPLHWRGDRGGLPDFNGAFVSLLGGDRELTADEMSKFQAMVLTITYGPNPNRNLDNSLRAKLGAGRPPVGEFIYFNQVVAGSTQPDLAFVTCVRCHTMPAGTNREITNASQLKIPQAMKVPQLRNVYEKSGFSQKSMNNNHGFGVVNDGRFADVAEFLHFRVFIFRKDEQGEQDRRDLQAFVESMGTDTHPAVGHQVVINASNAADRATLDQLQLMREMADRHEVGLVAHGLVGGAQRGYAYIGGFRFQSDRASEQPTLDDLLAGTTTGDSITFMAVPAGSEIRLGVDENLDGVLNGDGL